MGISASYISQDGGARVFDLEGAPDPGSFAAGLLGAHASQMRLPQMGSVPLTMPDIPSMSNEPEIGRVTEQNLMEALSRVLPPVGEIVSDGYALRLRGAEGGVPGGNVVYGSLGGATGFYSLSQLDPGGGGTVLNGMGDSADGASAQMNGIQGATIRIGRTFSYIEKDTEGFFNWFVVKNFYRLAQVTPNGRVAAVSGEKEELVCRIYMPAGKNGGGAGSGKYGVRLFSNRDASDPVHPVPDAFAFGAEEDLDTWDESSGRFLCNYDESGNVLENPPVKVIAVATCPGGNPGGA